jgi:amino acid transporter
MAVKFVPIVFALIIGYIFLGVGNPIPDHTISTLDPFIKLSPYLGLLMSIPSIIFIFDGFYACTAIQTSMKRPEKMPTAMMAGLIIVATISFLMSASLLLSTSNGSMDDYGTNGFIPN